MRRAPLRVGRHRASRVGVDPPRDGGGNAPLRARNARGGAGCSAEYECGALRFALAVIERRASEWILRATAAETLRCARRTLAAERVVRQSMSAARSASRWPS